MTLRKFSRSIILCIARYRAWRGKARSYGLEIIRTLEKHSDLVLSEGTVYPILNRLRDDGLVTSSWVESESGHPRKYYSLTRKGYDRATRMAEVWLQFTAGVNLLIEPLLPAAQGRVRG